MAYQVIILVIPLIISPYLTNTLGADAIGVYTYAYTIAYMFFIVGRLGVVEYGTREIASCQGDDEKLAGKLWTIFFTHGIFSILSVIAYAVFVLFFCPSNQTVFWTQILFVFSTFLDFTWVYFGVNKFKSLIMRNVFVKVLELVLIFIFVKNEHHLILYSIIMSLSYLMGNVVVLPYICKTYKFKLPSRKEILHTMKPLLVLSVSIIALNVYQTIDKVLLGVLTNETNVGFYEYSEKLVKVPVHIINSISTVMLPTMTYLITHNEIKKAREKFESTLILLSFLSFAFIFGMASVSDIFIPLYYNSAFIVCARYLAFLTPLIFLLTFNNTLRAQFLLPYHRDKEYVISLLISTIVNLVLSLILIPIFGVVGAIVGTIAGESVATVFEVIIVRKYISIAKAFKSIVPFLVTGIAMYLILWVIKPFLKVSWINLFILVIIGGTAYCLLAFLYLIVFEKDQFSFLMSTLLPKSLLRKKKDVEKTEQSE